MTRRRNHSKRIIVIAGPNGAGKTTFATEFLQNEAGCPDFINADLIAKGLSPFAPEKAAVEAAGLMLEIIRRKVERGESFAFETTLSGRVYAGYILRWRKAGYHVKARVAQGGHQPRAGTGVNRGTHRSVKSMLAGLSPEMQGVLPALRRAALAARRLAEATGTPFYVGKNGRVVDLNASRKNKKPRHGKLNRG